MCRPKTNRKLTKFCSIEPAPPPPEKRMEKQQENGEPPGTKQKKTKQNGTRLLQNFKYVSARDVFIC